MKLRVRGPGRPGTCCRFREGLAGRARLPRLPLESRRRRPGKSVRVMLRVRSLVIWAINLLHRAAGRRLDDDEVDQHDAESELARIERHPPDDIGEHGSATPGPGGRRRARAHGAADDRVADPSQTQA